MADGEYSESFGRRNIDRTFSSVPTLQWSLQPLPLASDHAAFDPPTSFLPTLTSLALSVISRNLHDFSAESFQGVPISLTRRVFIRSRDDRQYDQEDVPSSDIPCPDRTSLWLLETQATVSSSITPLRDLQSHTAVLPAAALLYSLPKPSSPISTVTQFTSITSLNFSKCLHTLNDQTCLNLRHLPNLTVLNLSNTEITDLGLAKMARCLDTDPDGTKRGLWGLKALYLTGCKKVGDRGVGALARFGGLCVLDIRETSCTEAAITVINNQIRKLFLGLATFESTHLGQHPASRDLFSKHSTGEDMAKAVLDLTGVEPHGARLHIIGTDRQVPQDQWPNPPFAFAKPTRQPVYRDSGIGNVYGVDVEAIPNPSQGYWNHWGDGMDSDHGSGMGSEDEDENEGEDEDEDEDEDEGIERQEAAALRQRMETLRKGLRKPIAKPAKRPRRYTDEGLPTASGRGRRAPGVRPSANALQAYNTWLDSVSGSPTPNPAQPAVQPWGSHMYATPSERSRAFIAPPSTTPVLSRSERRRKLQASEVASGSAYLMLTRQVPDEWELPKASSQMSDSHGDRLAREREMPVQIRKRQSTAMSAVGGGSSVELLLSALDARIAAPVASRRSKPSSSSFQEIQIMDHAQSSSSALGPGAASGPEPLTSLRSTRKRPPSPGLVPRPLHPLASRTTAVASSPFPASSNLAKQNPFKTTPKPRTGGVVSLGFESSSSKRKWGAAVAPEDKKRRGMVMFGAKR